jgi:hypothetical protein
MYRVFEIAFVTLRHQRRISFDNEACGSSLRDTGRNGLAGGHFQHKPAAVGPISRLARFCLKHTEAPHRIGQDLREPTTLPADSGRVCLGVFNVLGRDPQGACVMHRTKTSGRVRARI